MADVIVGKSTKDKLVTAEDKTQVYGLAGNDSLISDGKNKILLVGGSGNDLLRMTGGSGTLSGGDGKDTFELNFSAEKKISAVIEDIDPTADKIIVKFDGATTPKLSHVISGNDVIWMDDNGYFNLTLKGSSDAGDYYEGDAHEYIWDVLRITNQERETRRYELLYRRGKKLQRHGRKHCGRSDHARRSHGRLDELDGAPRKYFDVLFQKTRRRLHLRFKFVLQT